MPRKILIVVDMQNDFVTGPLGTPEARAIVPAVVNKIEAFLSEAKDHFVVFTKDTHTSSYLRSLEGKYLPVEHCLLGSSGRDVIGELDAFYKSPRAVSRPKMTFGYHNVTEAAEHWNYYNDIVEMLGAKEHAEAHAAWLDETENAKEK